MKNDRKLKRLTDVLTFLIQIKGGVKTNNMAANFIDDLKEMRQSEKTPLISDMINEIEKYVDSFARGDYDLEKIDILIESVQGLISHYQHNQN